MTNTLFHVITQGNKAIGCVVARKLDNDTVRVGWSKCLLKPTVMERKCGVVPDRFNKERAIAMAKNRTTSKDHHYGLTLADAENASQETEPHIPGDIRKHLRKMAQRARRYFRIWIEEDEKYGR